MFLPLQVVLKCADIGHLAAAPRVHKRWAVQLEEEFFRQEQLHSIVTLSCNHCLEQRQVKLPQHCTLFSTHCLPWSFTILRIVLQSLPGTEAGTASKLRTLFCTHCL